MATQTRPGLEKAEERTRAGQGAGGKGGESTADGSLALAGEISLECACAHLS